MLPTFTVEMRRYLRKSDLTFIVQRVHSAVQKILLLFNAKDYNQHEGEKNVRKHEKDLRKPWTTFISDGK